MADKKEFSTVTIRTGIDPIFLTDTLTTDVELADALFDLIDNSIDAARNHIIHGDYTKDEYGLPNDYSNYKIKLRLGSNSISIVDNCVGIEGQTLEENAFYTGKRSNHSFGIGHYGLGLKRALLKAGNKYALVTDNGSFLYKAVFDTSSFSGSTSTALKAQKYKTSSNKRTMLFVTNLKDTTLQQIKDDKWISRFIDELSVRYSIFVRKGLKIKVLLCQRLGSKTVNITPKIPEIRNDDLIKPFGDVFSTSTVNTTFSVGIHEGYKFVGEYDYNLKNNKKLTESFGLYFICNDRVIVAASKETRYGFTPQWHSEYGGFICKIMITSENPEHLPWNTSKTELKVNSPLFIKLRDRVEPLALEFRSKANNLNKKIWGDKATKDLSEEERRDIFAQITGFPVKSKPISLTDEAEKLTENSINSTKGNTKASSSQQNNNVGAQTSAFPDKPVASTSANHRPPVKHSRDRKIFVDWDKVKTHVPKSRTKEYDIFAELCSLNSQKTPITCVVMLRVFLETTAKQTSLAMGFKWDGLSKTTRKIAEKLYGIGYIDPVVNELILQYLNTDGGLFSIKNIQSQVHSTRFHPNQARVNTYWDELDQFLAGCWKFIVDHDNESGESAT